MAHIGLECIGKFLKCSGAESILVESSVFGVNTVDSVLSESNYVRSLKGQQLLKEALRRLIGEGNLRKCRDVLNTSLEMRDMVAKKSSIESKHLLQQFKATSVELISDFDQFILKCCEKSETFRFWVTFIHLKGHLENLICGDLEGNWIMHLQSVQNMLPIFPAFDLTNYLLWSSLYLEDM